MITARSSTFAAIALLAAVSVFATSLHADSVTISGDSSLADAIPPSSSVPDPLAVPQADAGSQSFNDLSSSLPSLDALDTVLPAPEPMTVAFLAAGSAVLIGIELRRHNLRRRQRRPAPAGD